MMQLLSDTLQKYFFMCGRHGSRAASVVMETKKTKAESPSSHGFKAELGLCVLDEKRHFDPLITLELVV